MEPADNSSPKIVHPGGLWLEDLSEGFEFESAEYKVTQEAIVAFASEFDPQTYHLDPDAATGTFFDRLVASGWHTAAITMKLLVQAFPIATGLIGAGGQVAWPGAVIPGDRLRVTGGIRTITHSTSRPGRATLLVDYRTFNQRGESRYESSLKMLAWSNPAK